MASHEVDARVGRLAAQQHGIFTSAQAERAGATSSLISRRTLSGAWLRVHPRTFALRGWERRFEGRALAAVWSLGAEAAAARRTAAALLGLVEGRPPDRVEVGVGRGGHQPRSFTVHEARTWPADHRTTVGIIPVTTVERTLVDLAATLGRDGFARLVDDALASGRAVPRRLGRVALAVTGRGVAGSTDVVAVLAERLDAPVPPASELERVLLGRLERGGWGPASRQRPVPGDAVPGLVDARLDHLRLIVEADGRRWHTRVADFARDRRRDRRAGAAGWFVARFAYEDLVDGGTELEDVVDAHARRAGWERTRSGLWRPAS